jgi:hypothetical protein
LARCCLARARPDLRLGYKIFPTIRPNSFSKTPRVSPACKYESQVQEGKVAAALEEVDTYQFLVTIRLCIIVSFIVIIMGLMRPITRKDTVLNRQNLLYSRICLLSSRLPAYLSALLALPANHCRRRKLREREPFGSVRH